MDKKFDSIEQENYEKFFEGREEQAWLEIYPEQEEVEVEVEEAELDDATIEKITRTSEEIKIINDAEIRRLFMYDDEFYEVRNLDRIKLR